VSGAEQNSYALMVTNGTIGLREAYEPVRSALHSRGSVLKEVEVKKPKPSGEMPLSQLIGGMEVINSFSVPENIGADGGRIVKNYSDLIKGYNQIRVGPNGEVSLRGGDWGRFGIKNLQILGVPVVRGTVEQALDYAAIAIDMWQLAETTRGQLGKDVSRLVDAVRVNATNAAMLGRRGVQDARGAREDWQNANKTSQNDVERIARTDPSLLEPEVFRILASDLLTMASSVDSWSRAAINVVRAKGRLEHARRGVAMNNAGAMVDLYSAYIRGFVAAVCASQFSILRIQYLLLLAQTARVSGYTDEMLTDIQRKFVRNVGSDSKRLLNTINSSTPETSPRK